jgi:tryptophanase
MSDKQWSEMMLGDESYAGASSYYKLKSAIKDLLGFDHFLPTHQGRAAENVLFSVLVKEGNVVPGNSHFDTTKGHIEFRKAKAIDCTIAEAFDTTIDHPFKGNLDLGKLEDVLKKYPREQVSMIVVTITCNSSGGQPVSLKNIKGVRQLADKYGVPIIFDSARFAENAYFIKTREEGQQDRSIREIVREMFSYADGMTMSSKKDAIVNIGGFIALRDPELFRQASVFNIMFEGFLTYGGLAGRDLNAIAQGLYEATEFEYLKSRVGQVAILGKQLTGYGVPMQMPYGGHAIFVDASKVLSHLPKEHFRAQTLAVELYIEAGVRGVEIGAIMADRDPVTRENRYPELELLRLAIPRRTYTNDHMNYVAVAMGNVYERRLQITTGLEIVEEAPILRHFTVKLRKI